MYCKFLTYKDCDSRMLAGITPEYISSITPPDTVCLTTCHRLEFYSNKPFKLSRPPKELAEDWNSIEGLENVLKRLAAISCGANSKILGENFIGFQSMRPFLKTPVTNLPFKLIDKAFEISQRVKALHNFETKFSYDTAAYQLLRSTNQNKPENLIIIGGGLLGQHISRHSNAKDYSKVTIITKQVKKCKADILHGENKDLIEVVNIDNFIPPKSFDVIIATNINDDSYKNILIKLVNNRESGATVDFCAVPLFESSNQSKLRYSTMYDKEFMELVKSANNSLIDIRPKVLENIDSMIKLLVRKGSKD